MKRFTVTMREVACVAAALVMLTAWAPVTVQASPATAASAVQKKKASSKKKKTTKARTTKATMWVDPDTAVHEVAAVQPQYPGGMEALGEFLASNLQYPEDAQQKGVDGYVIMQFIVEKDGSLSHIKVIRRGKLPSLDAEAVRVCCRIKDFIPGRNEQGQPVRVMYTLPIHFKLE